jgi:hypothetical protein
VTIWLQFTINVRKSHCQPQCTLQLVCEDRVLFVWVNFHVSLCGQQHPNCKRAIRLVNRPSFVTHFFIQTHRQKYNGWRFTHLHFGNHSELGTCLYGLFFLQWPILSPPKIFAFPTESSCIAYGHNIHAILHDTFHWSFIYYHGKLSVNFVYQSAAIWSCYVMLHARHASGPKASPHASQRTLPQPTIVSMAAKVWCHSEHSNEGASHSVTPRPLVPGRSNMHRGKTSANDRNARRRISSSYEVSRNYHQRNAPQDTVIKTETKVFLDNISIHVELPRKLL